MMVKGIHIGSARDFTEDKRLNARLWKSILISQGEEVVRKNFQSLFHKSTLALFPEKLTPESLEHTFLSLTQESLKYKKDKRFLGFSFDSKMLLIKTKRPLIRIFCHFYHKAFSESLDSNNKKRAALIKKQPFKQTNSNLVQEFPVPEWYQKYPWIN